MEYFSGVFITSRNAVVKYLMRLNYSVFVAILSLSFLLKSSIIPIKNSLLSFCKLSYNTIRAMNLNIATKLIKLLHNVNIYNYLHSKLTMKEFKNV